MTQLFQNLEKVCNACIFSAAHQNTPYDYHEQLQQQTLAIKKQLKDLFFKPFDSVTFENIINLHDSFLNELLDEISYHLDIERTRTAVIHAQQPANMEPIFAAYHQVSSLLEFIHGHFNSFISQHRSISRHYRQTAIRDIKEVKNFIHNNLPVDTCSQLREFLLNPVNDFLTLERKCTWHNLYYCQHICAEFKRLIERTQPNDDDLLWLLFRLNYNHYNFYNYITLHIREHSHDNYLEYLYTVQRSVGQAIFPQNVVLDAEAPPIDQMLGKWLKEEIGHLKRIEGLQISPPVLHKNIDELAEKIWANMSVAEFAYLFKLFSETGLLSIPNHKVFFDVLTRTYRTKNTENISSESLRSKFYKPESSVKTNVKGYLIELLNRINASA